MDHPLRTEINQLILNLPENQLKLVLEYLRQLEQANQQLETTKLVEQIFEEDAGLLKRLAQ